MPTLNATTAPTLEGNDTIVDEELFNLLSSVSFDNGEAIQDSGSPQNLAYTWLAGTDTLATLSTERQIQRYSMAALFFSIAIRSLADFRCCS